MLEFSIAWAYSRRVLTFNVFKQLYVYHNDDQELV